MIDGVTGLLRMGVGDTVTATFWVLVHPAAVNEYV
jgi:hypothetical protein